MDWMDLLLLVAASFRLTHLLVFDALAKPLRTWLAENPFWGAVIQCYWCCGIWVSGLLVVGYWWQPAMMRWLLLVLAVAGGQALIEAWVQRNT